MENAPVGTTAAQIAVESEIDKLRIFCRYIDDYLEKNPPSTIQPMDRSYGIKLTTGEAFTIGVTPPAARRGSMQPSVQHAVTGDPHAIAEAYGVNLADSAVLSVGAAAAGNQPELDLSQFQGKTAFDKKA